MLIAQAIPFMKVYNHNYGSTKFSGHVIHMPQDIERFFTKLPQEVKNLLILYLRRKLTIIVVSYRGCTKMLNFKFTDSFFLFAPHATYR